LFALVLLAVIKLAAQNDNFTSDYLHSYPQTSLTAVKAPLQWEKSDWLKAGGIIFIGSTLYLFDKEIADLVVRNRTSFTNEMATVGNQFGDGRYVLPALGITYLGGHVFHSPKTKDTVLLSLKSFLLANGMTTSLKYLTQRQRPYRNNGKQFWNGEGFSHKRESFPSGHTTVVWSIAPVLAEQYKDKKWVAPTVYSIACLTSYSRMHDEKHWSSDVFAGAVIGYVTSQLVLKTTPRLQITMTPNPQSIMLGYRF